MTNSFKELVDAWENYQRVNKKSLRDLTSKEKNKIIEQSKNPLLPSYDFPKASFEQIKNYEEAEKTLIKALDDYLDARINILLSHSTKLKE